MCVLTALGCTSYMYVVPTPVFALDSAGLESNAVSNAVSPYLWSVILAIYRTTGHLA